MPLRAHAGHPHIKHHVQVGRRTDRRLTILMAVFVLGMLTIGSLGAFNVIDSWTAGVLLPVWFVSSCCRAHGSKPEPRGDR